LAPSTGTTAPAVICVAAGATTLFGETVSDDLPELIHGDYRPAADHLGPCPPWCKGRPHDHDRERPNDQFHVAEPVELLVEIDGRMVVHAGAEIVQYPMSMFLHRRGVEVSMYWEDGDGPLDANGLHTLADGLVDYAGRLRELAARLVHAQAEDLAAKAWRT
jgi:hypothetical protein